jgi:hypothetical protein
MRAQRKLGKRKKVAHVFNSCRSAGCALAWWVLCSTYQQFPHSFAADLRRDLNHYELRRRQTICLVLSRCNAKAEPDGSAFAHAHL